MGSGKKKKGSSEDYSDEERRKKESKKRSAKERKRELEAMYGSQPVPPTQARPENNRMASSLPTDLDGPVSPRERKKSTKAKKRTGATAMEDNEQSFAVHDLVQRRPNMTRVASKKETAVLEQSFEVEELVEIRHRSPSPRPPKHKKGGAESLHGRGQYLKKENSGRPQMKRGRSTDRSGMLQSQHSSRPAMGRSGSEKLPTRSLSRTSSSRRGRSLDRAGLGIGLEEGSTRRGLRPVLSSQLSRPTLRSQHSSRPALNSQISRSRSMSRSRDGNLSGSIVYDGHANVAVIVPGAARPGVITGGRRGRNIRRFLPRKKIEQKPSRSIVVIWLIVASELGFDFGTTVIAFLSFLEEDTCCGQPISLGPLPIGVTVPFLLLILTELALLVRAIVLTLWPSLLVGSDDDTETDDLEDPGRKDKRRSSLMRCCCRFFRWKISILLQLMNVLILLNPFFGCIIAWILMYQTDETEAFVVLGLEGGSLILHFVSVWLEGSYRTCKDIAINLIPVIPFFVSIGLVTYYLKQGGVCYLVEERVFKFTGCEVCNITGVLEPCPAGTSFLDEITDLDSFDKFRDKVLERTDQGTYCSVERSFCFYSYDDGQVPPVNGLDSTNYPTEFLLTEAVTSTPSAAPGDTTDVVATPEEDEPDQEITIAPTNPPETFVPTRASVPPTSISTDPPTVAPAPDPTRNPTPVPSTSPVEEQQVPSPGAGEGGSDGFNMDEIGSDGFDPNDLFG
ncbi:hypothetical protein IV203_015337 [Nitzschia inconspicua]|uniref:Uncharacterized protein n=1 Tax=Nitzschia inconspicua TaxID=303405 RepID=A0A9K3LB68_9STRA|nr:hypothetical protein IV203_015337 [Nitzschia inconspicua]